jgi:hypothetical protein
MNVLLLAAALSLLAAPARAPQPPAPDFAWASSAAARALMVKSRVSWEAASAVPDIPGGKKRSPRPSTLDDSFVRDFVNRADFATASYALLDAAMARLEGLEKSRGFYEKAARAAGSSETTRAKLDGFLQSYHFLKSTLRLAAAVARAGVSVRMAGSGNSSYCFQAMESAIDTLRDAAADASLVAGSGARAAAIRQFRADLLQAWESAQRTRDLHIIQTVDLPELFDREFSR